MPYMWYVSTSKKYTGDRATKILIKKVSQLLLVNCSSWNTNVWIYFQTIIHPNWIIQYHRSSCMRIILHEDCKI